MQKTGPLLRTSLPKITAISFAQHLIGIPKDKILLSGFKSSFLPEGAIKLCSQSESQKQSFIYPTGTIVVGAFCLKNFKLYAVNCLHFHKVNCHSLLQLDEIQREIAKIEDGLDLMGISRKMGKLA